MLVPLWSVTLSLSDSASNDIGLLKELDFAAEYIKEVYLLRVAHHLILIILDPTRCVESGVGRIRLDPILFLKYGVRYLLQVIDRISIDLPGLQRIKSDLHMLFDDQVLVQSFLLLIHNDWLRHRSTQLWVLLDIFDLPFLRGDSLIILISVGPLRSGPFHLSRR